MEELNEQNSQQFLTKCGLNWTVEKQKIKTVDTDIVLPNHVAIVRSDNNEVLSVMGKAYSPYQNDELLELLFRVSKLTGFEIAKGGLFGGGQKVYIQLKSDNLTLGDDLIEGYLTSLNTFNGTGSLAFGASNVTLSCENQFHSAFKRLTFSARHTKNMRSRIDEICDEIEKAKVEETRIFNDIKLLAQTDSDERTKDMVIKKLFGIDLNVDMNDLDAIATRTRNKINVFKVDLKSQLDDKGDTMWGLFSGVTKYTTHTVGNYSRGEYNPNAKMYNFYGKKEQAIFHELVNLSNIGKH